MSVEQQARARYAGPTAAGLVVGLVVVAILSMNGSLANAGISAILGVYALAAGVVAYGLIVGRKLVDATG